MRRFGVLIICIGIAASLMLWNQSRTSNASSSDESVLLQLSESLISGDRTVTFKYGASMDAWPGSGKTFENEKQLLQAGEKICKELQFTAGSGIVDSQYACGTDGDRSSAQVKLTLLADRSAYLFVMLKTHGDGDAIQSLVQERQAADEVLNRLGINGAWNTIVNGPLAGSPQTATDRIVKQIKATEVERYSDEGTDIYAYRSPELHTSIASGKERINLQAALRRHSETGEWSITLGTPVITGEIGE